MDDNVVFALIGLFIFAMLLQAYQMGWQAGHDIHHDDEAHGPSEPKPPNRSLYV